MTHPITKEQLAEFIAETNRNGWESEKGSGSFESKSKRVMLKTAQAILDKVFEGAMGCSMRSERLDRLDEGAFRTHISCQTPQKNTREYLRKLEVWTPVFLLPAPAADK